MLGRGRNSGGDHEAVARVCCHAALLFDSVHGDAAHGASPDRRNRNAVDVLDADHDILAALDRWVEHGVAPSRLIASHFTAGMADKTRPICAYPKIARFKGKGDPNQPDAWVCTDGRERFESDYAQELRNIRSDVKTGNLDNLPNGGFVRSRRHR